MLPSVPIIDSFFLICRQANIDRHGRRKERHDLFRNEYLDVLQWLVATKGAVSLRRFMSDRIVQCCIKTAGVLHCLWKIVTTNAMSFNRSLLLIFSPPKKALNAVLVIRVQLQMIASYESLQLKNSMEP